CGFSTSSRAIDERISIVCGDMELEACGIDDDLCTGSLRHVKEFWHFAASLEFDAERSAHIERQNVVGVVNAVNLAQRLGVERFIYISTAYTCGIKTGRIPEELHPEEGPFNNFYEETKCKAEHLVSRLCSENGMALTILRPAIVIGDSTTFRPGGSETGLYGFIRELSMIAPSLQATRRQVRIKGLPTTRPNFIPVNHLVEDIFSLVTEHGIATGIYHLTSSGGVTSAQAVDHISAELDINNLSVTNVDEATMSPIERLLSGKTKFYSAYLEKQKDFVRKIEKSHRVSESDFRAFVIEGLKSLGDFSVNKFFVRSVVRSTDGTQLNLYVRDNPTAYKTVVIINAFGMPVDFVVPLSERLCRDHRVITWESRCLPSNAMPASSAAASIGAHVQDLQAILDHLGLEQVHLVGWCTGATVAIRFAAEFPHRTESLSLLSGGYNLSGAHETPFQINMREIMPLIAADKDQARFFFETLFKQTDFNGVEDGEASSSLNRILSSTNPRHAHLTSFPFRNEGVLFNYARLINALISEPIEKDITRIIKPCLVATGLMDVTASPESSIVVSEFLSGSDLFVDPESDHFMLHDNKLLHRRVHEFINGVSA
ncbi:MAG: alpha/beta fold hydrolase, partial [Moraxellaceae bacterium]|nr:alpha/beta fold hydrolase [Moraxellaceae bacterium]